MATTTKPYNIAIDENAAHYWAFIFGRNSSPQEVVSDFDLRPGDLRGFLEWLGEAEAAEAADAYDAAAAYLGDAIGFARRACAEDLQRAAQEVADEEAGDDDDGGVCEHGHSHHGVCPRCRAFALSGA